MFDSNGYCRRFLVIVMGKSEEKLLTFSFNKKLSYRKETALQPVQTLAKYKCEKRASNIALCYGVDVDDSVLRYHVCT